ncbi:hypothetical protein BDF14DRAFT_1754052 [Spinellus fusiger]|nr:hypothetical protein BDF14DRAFT_1754052 [Spinellus fusiger]
MKSTLISALAAFAAINTVSAVTFVTPWSESNWVSGGHGNITWTSTPADSTLNCEIQMLNGNATSANLVAYVTSAASPVPCSVGKFDIYPLNDFDSGKYSLRIGQSATNNWSYSGVFNFVGNGTIKPLLLASSAGVAPGAATGAAAATGANPTGAGVITASVSGAKPTGAAAASGSAASQSNKPSSAGIQLSAQNNAILAVAGGAMAALAMLL